MHTHGAGYRPGDSTVHTAGYSTVHRAGASWASQQVRAGYRATVHPTEYPGRYPACQHADTPPDTPVHPRRVHRRRDVCTTIRRDARAGIRWPCIVRGMRLSDVINGLAKLLDRYGDIDTENHTENPRGSSRVSTWSNVDDLSGVEAAMLAEGDWAPARIAACSASN